MSDTDLTLQAFFFDRDDAPDETAPAIRDAVNAVPSLAWPGAAEVVAGKLAEALDLSLADILAEAWNTHHEIQRAARDSLGDPGETFYVPLATHTLTSSHMPRVEVVANDQPVHSFVFDLRVSLKLEGAVLEISDGRIRAVSAGNCRGEGQIKLGEAVLVRRQSRKLKLFGAVGLGEGLPVPGIDARADEAA